MKKFCIIGNPISHSLSPILHNYWFSKYKIDAEYNLLEIDEKEIKKTLEKISSGEISGINITLPFKQKVIPHLSIMINDAKDSNSVNTIYHDKETGLIGENTDVYGFQAGYLKSLVSKDQKNKKTLILGAGGVCPSIILALQKSGIKNISLTNRTYEKSIFIKKQFPFLKILKWEDHSKFVNEFDLMINATSLGLKNGNDFENFYKDLKPGLIYVDTIYNPLQTNMIKYLKSKNIKTFNGLDMFIYQGQKSFYIWNKINPEIDENLINLLEKKLKE
tara:strand:+ start:172 stop:999 length:828 start_codon:yes stop_codon:yes gene_type:complete